MATFRVLMLILQHFSKKRSSAIEAYWPRIVMDPRVVQATRCPCQSHSQTIVQSGFENASAASVFHTYTIDMQLLRSVSGTVQLRWVVSCDVTLTNIAESTRRLSAESTTVYGQDDTT